MPDGLSNGGAKLEREALRRRGGVALCSRCRLNWAQEGAICAECAAEDRT